MSMKVMRTQHAFCDGEGCTKHRFMIDCLQDELLNELRKHGWTYNCQTRKVLCPECSARAREEQRARAREFMAKVGRGEYKPDAAGSGSGSAADEG